MNNEAEFFNFVYERHRIWHNRFILKLPWPWTSDPVLRDYKFCNVYRELDRGTRYIVEKILKTDLSRESKLFNVFAYRIFNLDQLFHGNVWNEPLDPHNFNVQKEITRLSNIAERGGNLFSGAYMIHPIMISTEDQRTQKHIQMLYLLEHLANDITTVTDVIQNASNIEEQLQALLRFPGIGKFMAGQMLLDLGYEGGISKLGGDGWLVTGPGSRRGIRLVYPDVKLKREIDERVFVLWGAQEKNFNILRSCGKSWDEICYRNSHNQSKYLSVMDIQNCLCEYSKYKKYSVSPGCKKRYYKLTISERTL